MSGPVKLSGWLVSIPASLALHAIPLALLLWLVTPQLGNVFIVDLTEDPAEAQVQPRLSESRPPAGPVRKPGPARPRSEPRAAPSAQNVTPAETPPAPPLATLAPDPMPRSAEPPVAPPQETMATPVSPALPPPAAAPEPMPQAAEPPRQAAPAIDAVETPPTTATRSSGTNGSASRTAVSGGGGDSAEAEYRAYLAMVRQRILEALRYPPAARHQGLVGTVYLEIVVQPTGAISDVKIVTPSSHPILDRAALDTVRSLPSIGFPPGLAPRQLRARLPVMFNLR